MSAVHRSIRRSAGVSNRVSSRRSDRGGSNGWSGNAVISSYHRACSRLWARHSFTRRPPLLKAGMDAPTAKNANSTSCAASVTSSNSRAKAGLGRSMTLTHRNSVRLTV